MAMINPLASMLMMVSAAFLLLLSMARMYAAAPARKGKGADYLNGYVAPLYAIGAFLAITGAFVALTWPLPSPYDIIFGDTAMAFGLILIAGGYAVRNGYGFESLSVPSAFIGAYSLVAGYQIWKLGLTNSPQVSAALFASAGLAGIVAYPALRLKSRGAAYAFMALAAVAAVTAFAIGVLATFGHIAGA